MKETARSHKIFEFMKYSALALLPILNIYKGILIINIGYLVLFALIIVELLIKKGDFEINKDMLIIFSIVIAANIIAGFIQMKTIPLRGTMNNTAAIMIVGVICMYYARSTIVDKHQFYKFLCVIGVISSVFLFVQFALYQMGIVVYGAIPGLRLDDSLASLIVGISIDYGRPASFFMEPAHFAIYILPIFALALFKKQFILSLVFLAALIVSTSSTGMMGALVVLAIFIMQEPKIPLIIKWVFLAVAFALFIQYLPDISGSSFLEKFRFVNLKENIRVFGTLEYFEYFSVKELLFGVGFNQLSTFLKLNSPLVVRNYASSLIFVFFSIGIVGGSIWTYFIYRLHRLSRSKILFIVFVIIYITDQILFNRNLVYLFLLLYIFSDSEEAPALKEQHHED